MNLLFGLFLLTLLVITALGIVRATSLFAAIMLSGMFSLEIVGIFFILDAADVAMTEAAVGAGLTTVLFLVTLARVDYEVRRSSKRRLWVLAVLAMTTLPIIHASFAQPRLGDAGAPVHRHVAPWYLEQTPALIDVPNVVTAVLASFRGYDTLGELFVIFTAGVGVLFILGPPTLPVRDPAAKSDGRGLREHLIPQVVGRFIVPLIVLFGLYVQFHGDYGPGGGFQAGALIAAGLILYAMLEGERAALHLTPPWLLTALMVGGALLYGGVGLAGIALGGLFLDYGVLAHDPVHGQHLGILLIEAGVGMTVTGVMLSIFHAFAARGVAP